MLHGGRVADDALERRYLLGTLASTDQDGSYQVSSSTGHGNCSSTVSEAGRSARGNDNLPLSRRLSFRKPTSRYATMISDCHEVVCSGSLELHTLSLLRTRLMMTASFSRPCMPSTVPISSSGPCIGRKREVRSVTWAWYLAAQVLTK